MASKLRLILLLLLPAAAYSADVYVPEELQDWREWVLEGKEYRDCPFFFNGGAADVDDYICAWPGELKISVDAASGRFVQQWAAYIDDTWLPLPGGESHWPHRVTVNGAAVEVIGRLGTPSIRVGPGSYRIAGNFEWDERPGVLTIPDRSGLLVLSVDGQRIERPARGRGGLFLGERQPEAQSRDAVQTTVYRMIHDNVPTRLTTTLRIDVSGGIREELFGPILSDGFLPMSVHSELPVRLEADGNLRVQVRPGRWEISLLARAPEVLNAILLPAPVINLPDTEIWSYQSNGRLRVTAVQGLPPVDPVQAQVPAEWGQLPAFRIEPGETFTITERSRGMVVADNELRLQRTLWLDFDGGGFAVRDQVGGTMRSGWRLDMASPYALLSASENGDDLLITNGESEGQSGIELREANVDVTGNGRAETRASMPVTGWDARFARVSTRLLLPPGYKLLAAPGVDRAPQSWVSRWQLLDFFLVLIITIAMWRLFGRATGVIALLALTLSFHEIGAPSWLWLNLLISIALLRVAPAGRLRQAVRGYQGISAVLLVFVMVPFVAGQLRIGIYPQLEAQGGSADGFSDATRSDFPAMRAPAAKLSSGRTNETRLRAMPEVTSELDTAFEEIEVFAAKTPREPRRYSRYAPNAIVQAGPGVPSWQWNSYQLNWSGPVEADQTMRLVILPRWAVTGLRFFEVFMLLLFTAVFAAEIFKRRWTLPGGLAIGGQPATAMIAAGMLAMFMFASPNVLAQTPDPELLRQLESRLLEPPDCVPNCAEIVAANVTVSRAVVNINLRIHATEDVAIPLPGSEQGWRPDAVLIDGSVGAQVIRGPDRTLWIRVAPGQHDVVLRGRAPAVDTLEIPFPAAPRFITVVSNGWHISGIKDRRLLSGSLQLTRLQAQGDDDSTTRWESSRFPAFVSIVRTVELDLDWRVTTTVYRQAPTQGALTVDVPLIDGETVLTPDMSINDGRILVSMSPTQDAVTWQSSLPRISPLVLTAQEGMPWSETWRVGVGRIWHAEFSGVPESETGGRSDGARLAVFHPRSAEQLTMTATRPEASAGSTLAFDAVYMDVDMGARSTKTDLLLMYRSTRGAQHVLRLPDGAEISEVWIDGRVEPLRADGDELTVPILPGEHVISVKWRIAGDVGARTRTPVVDIGAPASNIIVDLTLPGNRWLLATNGPPLGPAVLYWSELAVLILFALILGRVTWTPLKTGHWLLLGLGFSTFSWPVLGIVIAWLLACGARDKWRMQSSRWRYNTTQVLIALATVAALGAILVSLPSGLLGTPDMHVAGNHSSGNSLNWFADRSDTLLPVATAWSAPMWAYKTLILAWALWLSFALLRWLPWVWQCFSRDGLWRPRNAGDIQATSGAE